MGYDDGHICGCRGPSQSIWPQSKGEVGEIAALRPYMSFQHIFDSVQHSLRRLGLEYIDVLQCHRFDPNTPIEETVGTIICWSCII
jgi:aryl-alcohol dehydrogenase-like predicted oxidoreductase